MSSRNSYLLFIEYDGTGFSGWQKQPGARTVQETVETGLSKIGLKKVKAVAAGRTDKGVHAQRQAVSVTFYGNVSKVFDIGYKLNCVLPDDVSVVSAEKIPKSFNARYKAVKKIYRYEIWNKPLRSVWHGKNSWHIARSLNLSLMRRAALYLRGKHDFTSFDASGSTQENKISRLQTIEIERSKGKVIIRITGDRFLYKMVRSIVGTLVDAGLKRVSPRQVGEILCGRNRVLAGQTAPANGLFLEDVRF